MIPSRKSIFGNGSGGSSEITSALTIWIDNSPSGNSASIPNTASIDVFSLQPTFSTTDIAVPMPGNELLMEFRRTLHVDSRIIYPWDQQSNNFRWASEDVLGHGWSTNIGAHVIYTENPFASAGHAAYTATVYDDVGAAHSFYLNTAWQLVPDIRSSFSNQSLRGDLRYDGDSGHPEEQRDEGSAAF